MLKPVRTQSYCWNFRGCVTYKITYQNPFFNHVMYWYFSENGPRNFLPYIPEFDRKANFQRQPPQIFFNKRVLKIFAKRETPTQLFLCENFVTLFRTPSWQNTSRVLTLDDSIYTRFLYSLRRRFLKINFSLDFPIL